jgi:hypothetical protein
LLDAWFGNLARVLQPGRAFYLWGGYGNCANYPPALQASGLYFAQALIWVKEHPVLSRKDYESPASGSGCHGRDQKNLACSRRGQANA